MSRVDIVVARRPLKGVPVGGTLSVSRSEAKLLVLLGKATYQQPTPPTQPAPSYQTRMMGAETPKAVEEDTREVEVEKTDAARPRRNYTRRAKTDE